MVTRLRWVGGSGLLWGCSPILPSNLSLPSANGPFLKEPPLLNLFHAQVAGQKWPHLTGLFDPVCKQKARWHLSVYTLNLHPFSLYLVPRSEMILLEADSVGHWSASLAGGGRELGVPALCHPSPLGLGFVRDSFRSRESGYPQFARQLSSLDLFLLWRPEEGCQPCLCPLSSLVGLREMRPLRREKQEALACSKLSGFLLPNFTLLSALRN